MIEVARLEVHARAGRNAPRELGARDVSLRESVRGGVLPCVNGRAVEIARGGVDEGLVRDAREELVGLGEEGGFLGAARGE